MRTQRGTHRRQTNVTAVTWVGVVPGQVAGGAEELLDIVGAAVGGVTADAAGLGSTTGAEEQEASGPLRSTSTGPDEP